MGGHGKRSFGGVSAAALLAALLVTAAGTSGAAQTCFGEEPTIQAEPGQVTRGTSGDDVIMGTSGADVIKGRGGDDLICAAGGDDRVLGQKGSDRINLGAGDDTAKGGSGNDVIYGKRGKDKISGNRGSDKLVGGGSADTLIGGGGADTLNGGGGDDECRGGGSADTGRRCEDTASIEEGPSAPKAEPKPAPAKNCHPSYTPCLTPASDYDCYGGSGNGPRYAGRVKIHGPDVYGLDTDDDGVGCDHLPPHDELFPD